MPTKIITGAIGSGKTKYCIDEMQKLHSKDADKRLVMLVPSHYSHETERMLINIFGGTGLNNIECTSLEKLARELVCDSLPKLGASGKNALVCRAVKKCLKEIEKDREQFDSRLIRAVSRRGFIDVAQSLISEMHRYNITGKDLLDYSETAETMLLSQKLKIAAIISDNYAELLSNTSYRDSDDDLMRLAGVIKNNFDKNTVVWIDKFDEFLPQQLAVVYALIDSGADVTITFSVCPDNNDTYYGTTAAINNISSYTAVKHIHLDGAMEHIKNAPDLKYLFSTWFDRSTYDEKCENAQIYISRDAYAETEHIASQILDLVREEHYRYRDIGIICGEYTKYSHIIEAIFEEYDIPYYSDERIAISEYPIAMQILSLFDIIENNWSYKSMFSYLRSGFIYVKENSKIRRLDSDELDILENYVLKYGIDYKSAWCRSWLEPAATIIDTALGENTAKSDNRTQMLEDLRIRVTKPILTYSEAAKKAVTVSDYCRALFGFLEDINLYQGLKGELLTMALNKADADAQRFGQIWNLMLDVLNQVHTALGKEKATHEEFCEYIRSAMSQCQIRTVPSGIDRVFIGSADMNRSIPTPIVFAVGAVSGTFPQTNANEGFLSNADREALQINGIALAPTTHKKTDKLRNTVYKLFSAATEKLFISYPSMTPDGNTNLPSQTVTDIMHKMKNIPVTDDLIPNSDNSAIYISSPKATLHKFLINPNDNPLWEYVDQWYKEHNEWKNKLFIVNREKHRFSHRKIELNPDIAKNLYEGKTRYSATRLNSFANCPFSHFLKYGLSAKESEVYEINAADTGSYAHKLIQQFCTTIDNDSSLSWETMDNEKCESIVSDMVNEAISNIQNSDLTQKEMTIDLLRRMGGAVSEAAKTVLRSIQCGDFVCESYEKEINIKLNDNIELFGIIDRLDVCKHDGENEYRIIDYKTGNKDFCVSDIYYGIDMQPVIYALAMRELDKDATISGMYYGLVHNDFAIIEPTSKAATADSRLRDNTAYKGVTFVGDYSDEEPPKDELERIESEYYRDDYSLFFSLRGGIKYNKSLRARGDSELLMDLVKKNIINIDKGIKDGDIGISPIVKGSRTPCTYCPYISVCGFDCAERTERKITEKDEEIWERLEAEQ